MSHGPATIRPFPLVRPSAGPTVSSAGVERCGPQEDTVIPADLTQTVEADHQAFSALVRGDPEPKVGMFSRAGDVTLANPLGPPARGFEQVAEAVRRGGSQMREGEPVRFERISEYGTADIAYIVEIEHCRAKLGGADQPVPFALRATTVYRREEDGVWRICHRHADAITTPRPIESLVDRSGTGA